MKNETNFRFKRAGIKPLKEARGSITNDLDKMTI